MSTIREFGLDRCVGAVHKQALGRALRKSISGAGERLLVLDAVANDVGDDVMELCHRAAKYASVGLRHSRHQSDGQRRYGQNSSDFRFHAEHSTPSILPQAILAEFVYSLGIRGMSDVLDQRA